jgi:hypothetical protein
MRPVELILGVALGLTLGGPAAAQQSPAHSAGIRTEPFPDVPKEHWAFDAVEQLRKQGIVRGYPPEPTPRPAARKMPRKSAKAAPVSRFAPPRGRQ